MNQQGANWNSRRRDCEPTLRQPSIWSWNLPCCRLFASSRCLGDQGAIGEGTLLRHDPGHIMLPNMKDFLLYYGWRSGIVPNTMCQRCTDAGAAHLKNGGVPSTTIGVCARYIHSPNPLCHGWFLQAQAFLQALVEIGSFYSWFDQTLLNNIYHEAP